MFRHLNDVRGFKLNATDDEFGKIKDFYFDDVLWTVRYLVADTLRWLPGRKVLVSPTALGQIDEENKAIAVNLSKQTIEASPQIEEDKPVSRQNEIELVGYYNWPAYWEPLLQQDQGRDPNLRSMKEVTGYNILALDGEIGKVTDVIFDDVSWIVRYMVIDTSKWAKGKSALIALDWIHNIDEEGGKIVVDVSKKTIEEAPEYKPEDEIDRAFETTLFDHYKKSYYWG